MWKFLSFWIAVLSIAIATNEDSQTHKTSIAVDVSDEQPYYATFDSTNVAYHWESTLVDRGDVKGIRVINSDDLSEEKLKELLAKSSPVESSDRFDGAAVDLDSIDSKSVFEKAQLFKQAGPANIVEWLRAGKAFVMILLCDCERDKRVAAALPGLESRIKEAKYDDLYSFMYLYPSAIFAFQLHKVFELGGEDVPAFLIDNVPIGANLEKYRYEKLLASSPESKVAASSSSMFEFVEQFQHRTLSMIVRSEPLPADSDEYQQGQVQTVVAKNFEKVVLNPSKNVFLLVYAPQCGGSIAVQPIIDQVAKEIDDPDVIIARMDGTRNDFPVRGIPLTHYPSAFFFPKGPSRKEDGQLNFISWDDHNGSKAPHNSHVPHTHYDKAAILAFLRGEEHDHDHGHDHSIH